MYVLIILKYFFLKNPFTHFNLYKLYLSEQTVYLAHMHFC